MTIQEILTKLSSDLAELVQALNATESTASTHSISTETSEPYEIVLCDFSMLREKLSTISRSGNTAQVRELLKKYGATKLSEVKSDDYNAVWIDADNIMKVEIDPLKEAE